MTDGGAALRPDFVGWLVRTHIRDDEPPSTVELVKLYYAAHPPGSGKRGKPRWRSETLYTWQR
jgi:hypothetical protein